MHPNESAPGSIELGALSYAFTVPTLTEPTLTEPTLTEPTFTVPTFTVPTLTEHREIVAPYNEPACPLIRAISRYWPSHFV